MGSRDRKQIAELVYCYYRLGHGWPEVAVKERVLIGIFLCNSNKSELLDYFKPEWNSQIQRPLWEKLSLIEKGEAGLPTAGTGGFTHLQQIFPWKHNLSQGIDYQAFSASFLIQPSLFIRVRPGFNAVVRTKLASSGLPFHELSASCIAVPNGTALGKFLVLDKEVVVQDLNSQKVGEFFFPGENSNHTKWAAWDCCAASGGKSILLNDLHPGIDLTVSDSRESILYNLSHRFHEAGLKSYHSFAADLSAPGFNFPQGNSFDMIIADLPCTGSGTWSRTPESLFFFDLKGIERYAKLQQSILRNIVPRLKPGGALIYITCSVFAKENEEQVAFLRKEFGLTEEKTKLLAGYEDKADSMFVSRLSR